MKSYFLDWYPKGRIVLLSTRQSTDLRNRVDFLQSISQFLNHLIKVYCDPSVFFSQLKKNELIENKLFNSIISKSNSKTNKFYTPHFSITESINDEVACGSRPMAVSDETFTALTTHELFVREAQQNEGLSSLLTPPVLNFDKAFYLIWLCDDSGSKIVTADFPPSRIDINSEINLDDCGKVFLNENDEAVFVANYQGETKLEKIIFSNPYIENPGENDEQMLRDYLLEKINITTRFLNLQSVITKRMTESFNYTLESSVQLIKIHESTSHVVNGCV